MEIKPTGQGHLPLGKIVSRPGPESPVQSEVKTGDGVSFGRLGSTLFQNGKAMSLRDAQALVGPSKSGESVSEQPSSVTGFDLNSTMALGGPDSPCFYKGQVMTTREAQELAAKEQADDSPV